MSPALDGITNLIAECNPYIALNVDLVESKVRFSAAVYVNGNEMGLWDELSPEDFRTLLDGEYSRIWFSHLDCSSEDFTEQQLDAILFALGVPQPLPEAPTVQS
jgi:hypothetical protein